MTDSTFDSCLGFLEVATIPSGIRALDQVTKAAACEVVSARVLTPAKFLIVLKGSVEALNRALSAGRESAGRVFLGDLVLAAPHSRLAERLLTGPASVSRRDALGLVETSTVVTALAACDVGLKTADVDLVHLHLAMGLGGRACFSFSGAFSDVEAAIECSVGLARSRGDFVDAVLLPQPSPETWESLVRAEKPFSDFPSR